MNQLSPAAQNLWPRLGVFVGSCSLEGIEAVGVGEDFALEDIHDLLAELTQQGMLGVEESDQEIRYRLPEALEPIARTQLAEIGEEAAVYRRLAAFLSRLAQQALQNAFGPQRSFWMNRLEQEYANYHSALDWLFKQGDAERGLELACLLEELWFEDRHTSEGREWLRKFLALPQANARTAQRAAALDLAGALALNQGDYAAADSLKEEGLSILRELGDPVQIGYALLHLGHLVGFAQGDLRAARTHYQEALDLLRAAKHAEGTAHALADLGGVAIELGDFDAALPLVAESLERYRDLGSVYDMALSLRRMAGIAAGREDHECAMRLAGAAAGQMAVVGLSLPPVFEEPYERMLKPARNALSEAEQSALWEEGQAMTLEQAVAYAQNELFGKDCNCLRTLFESPAG